MYGRLNLHGVTRKVTWGHLAATAFVNNNTIQLVEETDWGKGDEIIVTTTSYESWETETFAIIEKIDEFRFRLNSSFEFSHIGECRFGQILSIIKFMSLVGYLTECKTFIEMLSLMGRGRG